MADLMQVITKAPNECCFGARTGQEPSIRRQRIKVAKESEAMDEFARVMAGVTSPADFFAEQNVERLLALRVP